MLLKEVTPAGVNPVPLRELSAHLRLANGFSDDGSEDGLLELYLRNATAVIETRLGQALINRPYVLQIACWNSAGHLTLPIGPVAEIDSFQLVSSAGPVSLAPTEWVLEPAASRQRVSGPFGQSLRSIPFGGIAELNFTAGHGPSWNEVPDDLRQAVLLLAAHFYENRFGEVEADGGIPFGVVSILQQHRSMRL